MISKQFAQKIYEVLDGKIALSVFEKWVYNNENLQHELSEDEYLQLISFNYNQGDASYELIKVLNKLLDTYLSDRNQLREKRSVEGLCVSKAGRYEFNHFDTEFNLSVGKKYPILSIQYSSPSKSPRSCTYTIIDDDESVYMVPSSVLNLNNEVVPEGWVTEEHNSGHVTIEPKEWSQDYRGMFSFWEDFYDGEESALLEFVKVLHKLNIEVPESFRIYAVKLLSQ